MNRKFYVVWKGRQTGIFDTWDATKAQVDGFSGAQYHGFEARAEAERAFALSYDDFQRNKTAVKAWLPEVAQAYSVDAASSGNPGLLEYRCVHNETRKELFHEGPFEDGTNNVGEFLAIVHALALFKRRRINTSIYSDSRTAIAWVKDKQCKTELARTDKNVRLFEFIARAEAWLRENDYSTPVLKWDTEAWGEIPADFGRK